MSDDRPELTSEEAAVLSLLAHAYNGFCALEVLHPDERDEFALHIHALQTMVMARMATRAYPWFFNRVGRKDGGDDDRICVDQR